MDGHLASHGATGLAVLSASGTRAAGLGGGAGPLPMCGRHVSFRSLSRALGSALGAGRDHACNTLAGHEERSAVPGAQTPGRVACRRRGVPPRHTWQPEVGAALSACRAVSVCGRACVGLSGL